MKPEYKPCESCFMPHKADPVPVRENEKYCSYCFKNGKLCYEGDLAGFKKICYLGMRKKGMPWLKAKVFTWLIGFAPRWKNKK